MIKKKSNSFLSCDGKTSVHVVMWCPDETEYDEPVAVLQICHGMIEYIDRYDGFARYMAERGFVVVVNFPALYSSTTASSLVSQSLTVLTFFMRLL